MLSCAAAGRGAVTSHAIWKRDVEDYAFVTLRTPSGIIFLNEASYTFPTNGSDSERKIAAEKALVRATNAGVIAFYASLGYQVEERVSMGKRL